MNNRIEYNKAAEFIAALYKYSSSNAKKNLPKNQELREDGAKDLVDFAPTSQVKQWLEDIDGSISPFLRNDLWLILMKVHGLLDVCLFEVIAHNIKDPAGLLAHLKKLDAQKLIELIYDQTDCELPFDSEDAELGKALAAEFDEESSLYFLQSRKHPEEYKQKVLDVFQTFFSVYYKPKEREVYSFMEKETARHDKLFQANQAGFLKTVGIGDYTKLLDEKTNLRIFVSYYIDLGMFHFVTDQVFLMLYGHSIEQHFNDKINLEKSKAVFKALSDETRLQIIRITSQRAWYNKELAEHFNLTTATLSYHLNLLLDLEILNFEPSVNNRYYYTTNKENLKKLLNMAAESIFET